MYPCLADQSNAYTDDNFNEGRRENYENPLGYRARFYQGYHRALPRPKTSLQFGFDHCAGAVENIVGYEAYGNSHQYHPLLSKEEYSKGQLSRLVSDYYDNSLKQIVNFFSESNKLNEQELDDVMKMLEDLKSQK